METINIENEYLNIDNIKEPELIINAKGICELVLFNKNFTKLTLNLLDDSKVLFNHYNCDSKGDTEILLNAQNNGEITYNLSEIVLDNHKLKLSMNYKGKSSTIRTNIHSLVTGKEDITIKGSVKREDKDNEMLENVKVILLDNGKSTIKPDMLIDTNLVTAFHKVAVSSIRESDLFYLRTKGLSKIASIKLIKKSFILSNITNKELQEKIEDTI